MLKLKLLTAMGCIQHRAAMYSSDGAPLIDTRYARDGKARRMATPDGQASRNSGALHRTMRSRRPVHSLDEPGLGSPPGFNRHGARGQEGRHRRSARCSNVLRKVVLGLMQNAGRMGGLDLATAKATCCCLLSETHPEAFSFNSSYRRT